jgi:hypothetical protein
MQIQVVVLLLIAELVASFSGSRDGLLLSQQELFALDAAFNGSIVLSIALSCTLVPCSKKDARIGSCL